MRRLLIGLVAMSVFGLMALATAPQAFAKAHSAHAVHAKKVKVVPHDPVIYDSTVNPLPGSLESTAFEATETTEYGNQIVFGGTARVLSQVGVTLDSFTCQSGAGFSTACTTTPGSTFTEPVTLNLYNVGSDNAVGSLIASDTQTFSIPYEPSADQNYLTDCQADVVPNTYFSTVAAFAGAWYDPNVDPVTGNPIGCEFGIAADITFTFGHVTLPNNIIYGIAYDTSDYGNSPNAPQYKAGGATPTGLPWGDSTACHASSGGCGYDGLNVANAIEPPDPTVGSDPNLGTAYLDSGYAPFYCDNGVGGTGTFRIDGRPDTQNCTGTGDPYNVGYSFSEAQGLCDAGGAEDAGGATVANTLTGIAPCTDSPYIIPAVQFDAVNTPSPTITSVNTATAVAGQSFSFTVTTDGVPAPTVARIAGKLPKGLVLANSGGGTGTIYGTALTKDHNGVYRIVIRARSVKNSVAKQIFYLTLTGGRA